MFPRFHLFFSMSQHEIKFFLFSRLYYCEQLICACASFKKMLMLNQNVITGPSGENNRLLNRRKDLSLLSFHCDFLTWKQVKILDLYGYNIKLYASYLRCCCFLYVFFVCFTSQLLEMNLKSTTKPNHHCKLSIVNEGMTRTFWTLIFFYVLSQ